MGAAGLVTETRQNKREKLVKVGRELTCEPTAPLCLKYSNFEIRGPQSRRSRSVLLLPTCLQRAREIVPTVCKGEIPSHSTHLSSDQGLHVDAVVSAPIGQ